MLAALRGGEASTGPEGGAQRPAWFRIHGRSSAVCHAGAGGLMVGSIASGSPVRSR